MNRCESPNVRGLADSRCLQTLVASVLSMIGRYRPKADDGYLDCDVYGGSVKAALGFDDWKSEYSTGKVMPTVTLSSRPDLSARPGCCTCYRSSQP